MNKLLSLILSVLMSLMVMPMALVSADSNVIYVDANVATDEESNTYATLAEAVEKATAGTSSAMGTTIQFKSDYSTTSAVSVNKKYITIDLNGFTYTTAGSTAQGISVAATGVVIQNGKIALNAPSNGTSAYYSIYNSGAYTLTIKNIAFELVTTNGKDGAGANNPGALVRNATGLSCITNIYDCSFVYSGTYDYTNASLVSCNTTTMNLYNCKFDGNGNKISGVQVRGNTSSQYAKLSIYNCEFKDVKYLFGKCASITTQSTEYIPQITLYSATVTNATALNTGEYPMSIAAAEHATMPALDTLTSPYTFEVACAHSYVDGVCEYCYASESTSTDPLAVKVSMKQGASIRLNFQTGIRFYTIVDQDKITALKNDGAEVQMGTLIAPLDYLTDTELTHELGENKFIDVDFIAPVYYGEDTFSGIVGSIINIKPTNTDREFVGRGYVKVTKDGKTTISYANYYENDIANNTRSLKGLSTSLKADTENYNNLSDENKLLVDEWASYNS